MKANVFAVMLLIMVMVVSVGAFQPPIIKSPIAMPNVLAPVSGSHIIPPVQNGFSDAPCTTCGVIVNISPAEQVTGLAAAQKVAGTWVAGETSVSKLSLESRKNLMGFEVPEDFQPTDIPDPRMVATAGSLPSSFDWRNNGGDYSTSVKDQRSCGSCWAFATNAVVESFFKIQAKNPAMPIDLSEQYLVSWNTESMNCQRGGYYAPQYYIDRKVSDLKIGGLNETDLPYTATTRSNANISSFNRIRLPGDTKGYTVGENWTEYMKQKMMENGPTAIAFRVYDSFIYYKSGIYGDYKNKGSYGLHLVTAYGWGSDANGKQYWICKNSWGPNWGDKGWFNIYMDTCKVGYYNGYLTRTGVYPTVTPTVVPTTPTVTPTNQPTPISSPTITPTVTPTTMPTTVAPTVVPTTIVPTVTPTKMPTLTPTVTPTPGIISYDFTADPKQGKAPLTVKFRPVFVGFKPQAITWAFGDGYTASNYDPDHRYRKAGKYTVSMYVKINGVYKTQRYNALIQVT